MKDYLIRDRYLNSYELEMVKQTGVYRFLMLDWFPLDEMMEYLDDGDYDGAIDEVVYAKLRVDSLINTLVSVKSYLNHLEDELEEERGGE